MTPKEMRDAADMIDHLTDAKNFRTYPILNIGRMLREHADEMEPGAVPHIPRVPPMPPPKRPNKWCRFQIQDSQWRDHWGCNFQHGPVDQCIFEESDLTSCVNGRTVPHTEGGRYCPVYLPATVPPPERVLPNIWDRCTALAVANGAAEHDHGHGDVAALVLKELRNHLREHRLYGTDNNNICCKRREEAIDELLNRDKGQSETDEQAASRIDGRSVTVTAQAYESQRLVVPVGYPRIAGAILKEHGVQITSVQMQKGLLKELGVFDVVVHVGSHAATVKVWTIQKEED